MTRSAEFRSPEHFDVHLRNLDQKYERVDMSISRIIYLYNNEETSPAKYTFDDEMDMSLLPTIRLTTTWTDPRTGYAVAVESTKETVSNKENDRPTVTTAER